MKRLNYSKLYRGKRICNTPFRREVMFSPSIKRQIMHKEQYLKRKAFKFFYVKNPNDSEFIMGFFGDDGLAVTIAHFDNFTHAWLTF